MQCGRAKHCPRIVEVLSGSVLSGSAMISLFFVFNDEHEAIYILSIQRYEFDYVMFLLHVIIQTLQHDALGRVLHCSHFHANFLSSYKEL